MPLKWVEPPCVMAEVIFSGSTQKQGSMLWLGHQRVRPLPSRGALKEGNPGLLVARGSEAFAALSEEQLWIDLKLLCPSREPL